VGAQSSVIPIAPLRNDDGFKPTPAPSGEVRIVNEKTGGAKGGKLARFDLLPWDQLWQVAELYGKGAQKYEERNWEKGYQWSLSFAAAMRHVAAWSCRETVDPETKCHHLSSAVFHLLALMRFEITQPDLDNRSNYGPQFQELLDHIEQIKAEVEDEQ